MLLALSPRRLGLVVLASTSASTSRVLASALASLFWPCVTSLLT